MKAALLISARSGGVAALGESVIREAAQKAAQKRGVSLTIISGEAPELIDAASALTGHDLILCAGGDGTIAAVAGVLMGQHATLAPLPCGTVNMLCRDLGIPLEIGAAIETAFDSDTQMIDVGRIGDRVFLNNIVFGAYAEIAEAREELRSAETLSEAAAAVANAAGAAFAANSMRYLLSIDGASTSIETNTVIVSNNAMTGAAGMVPQRARLDEGALSVYLAETKTIIGFAGLLAMFANGGAEASLQIQRMACEQCTISGAGGLPLFLTIDGDAEEFPGPISFSIARSALKVIRPRLPAEA
ncbi:MAG: diacylglycerol/lipid kinase family protein [Parvularculaceae bacterium]